MTLLERLLLTLMTASLVVWVSADRMLWGWPDRSSSLGRALSVVQRLGGVCLVATIVALAVAEIWTR